MKKLIINILIGQMRHALTITGASLVTKGVITNAQEMQITGAVMTVIGLLLSQWDKVKAAAQNGSISNTIPVVSATDSKIVLENRKAIEDHETTIEKLEMAVFGHKSTV